MFRNAIFTQLIGGTAAQMEERVFELQRRLRTIVNDRMISLCDGPVTIQTVQRIYDAIPWGDFGQHTSDVHEVLDFALNVAPPVPCPRHSLLGSWRSP